MSAIPPGSLITISATRVSLCMNLKHESPPFENCCHVLFRDKQNKNQIITENMVDNQGITLTSNWSTLGEANLHSVLIGSSSDDAEINLDDMTADNCVCLVRNDDRENSKAHLEIKANGCIKSIILMSEAQVIEVFGVNDEYLLTHNSEFFDDWEELAVYHSKISLPNIPVCKLKFTRTRNEDRVWIYGAKIHVQSKTNHLPEIPINFNFEQISRLLGNSNFTNLNMGNNIKNLLHASLFDLLGRKPKPHDTHTKTSSSMPNESNRESGVTELLSRLLVNSPDSAESQKTCSKQMSSESCSNNWLTSYIDKKCNEMKTGILLEIDAKINNLREETNEKLDRIISLLEERAITQ